MIKARDKNDMILPFLIQLHVRNAITDSCHGDKIKIIKKFLHFKAVHPFWSVLTLLFMSGFDMVLCCSHNKPN